MNSNEYFLLALIVAFTVHGLKQSEIGHPWPLARMLCSRILADHLIIPVR